MASRVVYGNSIPDGVAGTATPPARPEMPADRIRRTRCDPRRIDWVLALSARGVKLFPSSGYALRRLKSRSAAGNQSVRALVAAIERFTGEWNSGASPFRWVKTPDEILAKAVRKPEATSGSGR